MLPPPHSAALLCRKAQIETEAWNKDLSRQTLALLGTTPAATHTLLQVRGVGGRPRRAQPTWPGCTHACAVQASPTRT